MAPIIQCAAVIPCLNEAATIARLVREVTQQLAATATVAPPPPGLAPQPNVLVVDDGSSDRTAELAQAAGALVLRHARPQGKGAALRTGLARAHQLGFTWAITLDGDGQHAPEDIGAFVRAAETTGAALVVGNRMAQPERMPWVRRQVNRWMSRRLSRMAGRPLPDTQCGFRLIELSAWARLPISTRHFEVESEMLLEFVAAGLRVEFVPIQVIYKSEQSKIHPLRDTWRWFQWRKRWTAGRPSRKKLTPR